MSDKQEKEDKDYIDETKDVKSFKELEDYSSDASKATNAKSAPKEEKEDPEDGKKSYKVRLIDEELETSFLNYSMSVIVSRALPDVRDGLKPVHRRILYSMHEMGMAHNKPYKKSARIVGDALGKYHPHGDSAVYDAMVRMAQSFSLRYPLVDGQGNFGSVDGDSAAAMRYTEARLTKIAGEMLDDIKKEVIDYQPNFDGSLKEPIVMPAKIPNLLLNGASGIAVGMATNIPPHNMNELIDGITMVIDDPAVPFEKLTDTIKGPDFPTSAIIQGTAGIKRAYKTGHGKIKIKAKADLEEKRNKISIIITELPYQVNKALLIEQIADCVRDKKITGISNLRDESDREGMRVVITLKKDANSDVVLNQLYKHTRMSVTFGINMLALVNNEPKVLNLRQIIRHFIDHRKEVVTRRTQFDLNKALDRAHILEGLKIALDNIDDIVAKIKASKNIQDATEALMTAYPLSEKQAKAILEMRLQKLSSLEQDKIREEYRDLLKLIKRLKEILADENEILNIIKKELADVKSSYGDKRRSVIEQGEDEYIEDEDLIKEEQMVVTISHRGYIKRQPINTYKQQRRGGKGVIAQTTKDDDFIENIFAASTHAYILFFTDSGQMHWIKVYQLPESSRQSKGKAIVNLLNLKKGERVTAFVLVNEFKGYLMMATRKGKVKRCDIRLFSRPRQGGIRAITLHDDHLISVRHTSGDDKLILATAKGMAVKFHEESVRAMGRTAAGVRGVLLRQDHVVDMVIAKEKETLLTITENGYGKRTNIDEYRLINRGGIGVINIQTSSRNGRVVAIKTVSDDDDIMIISQKGIAIRMTTQGLSVIGRNTQGFRIMRMTADDKVVSAAKIEGEEP